MSLGNGMSDRVQPSFLTVNHLHFEGSGITTTLIALIANAGAKDQAIATAGPSFFLRNRCHTETLIHFGIIV